MLKLLPAATLSGAVMVNLPILVPPTSTVFATVATGVLLPPTNSKLKLCASAVLQLIGPKKASSLPVFRWYDVVLLVHFEPMEGEVMTTFIGAFIPVVAGGSAIAIVGAHVHPTAPMSFTSVTYPSTTVARPVGLVVHVPPLTVTIGADVYHIPVDTTVATVPFVFEVARAR